MDTKALVTKLRQVFQENNRKGTKKYSQIWLKQLNYGGLYYSNNFALCLKADHDIERYFAEISEVSKLLRDNAEEDAKSIMRIKVYRPDEQAEPEIDDFVVYEEETSLS